MKKLFLLIFFVLNLSALEFGSFGRHAGVAVRSSDFALHCNPALISYTKSGLAFDLGAQFSQKNLIELSSIDKSLSDKIDAAVVQIKELFSRSNDSQITQVVAKFIQQNQNHANLGTLAQSLGAYAQAVIAVQTNPALAGQLVTAKQAVQTSLESLKSNPTAISELKLALRASAKSSPQLVQTIIANINPQSFPDILDAYTNPTTSTAELLSSVGGMDISALLDAKTASDIYTLYDAIYDNDVSVLMNTGLELNYPRINGDGSFAIGVLSSVYANANAALSHDHPELIIHTKDLYFRIYKQNGGLYVKSVDEQTYLDNSAFAPGVGNPLSATMLALNHIPVGYAEIFELDYGELSLGASIDFINAIAYHAIKGIELDLNGAKKDELKFKSDLAHKTTTYAASLDLGVLYSIDELSFGVVAKHLSQPRIKLSSTHSVRLRPQYRAGIAYADGIATVAIDYDLVPNTTLSHRYPKSQIIALNTALDLSRWASVRLGVSNDFKKHDGAILSGGFGLFDVFDLTVSSGLKRSKCSSDVCSKLSKVPNYFALDLGFKYRF